MLKQEIITELKEILGAKNIFIDSQKMEPYKNGFRFGRGMAHAVVIPQNLLQLWQIAKIIAKNDLIAILQAANTSLTGGATPYGENYSRPVIIINTTALKGIYLLNDATEVLALPGESLTELEYILQKYNREAHSTLGSSCIGATIIGGIANSAGGALIRRGPAYTEMALYAKINQNGTLELINETGIDLGEMPEEIITNLQNGKFSKNTAKTNKKRWCSDYAEKIKDLDADTPARFNADPSKLYAASGCAGKIFVFAVRLQTFKKIENTSVFYIGSNQETSLVQLRRKLIQSLPVLPISAEYLDRTCYNLTDKYGKHIYLMVKLLGPQFLPNFYRLKNKLEGLCQHKKWLKNNFSDRLIHYINSILPKHLPKRMNEYCAKYQYHLMIKIETKYQQEMYSLLNQHFLSFEGNYFLCDKKESKAAFMHRFAAGSSAGSYNAITNAGKLISLDIAFRRNDLEYSIQLPDELKKNVLMVASCGHFFCNVVHVYYIVTVDTNVTAFKKSIFKYLHTRKAIFPAEHNIGHLYTGTSAHLDFLRNLDPTNSLNPGLGQSSKEKYWQN